MLLSGTKKHAEIAFTTFNRTVK